MARGFKSKIGTACKQGMVIAAAAGVLALADSIVRSDAVLIAAHLTPVPETTATAARAAHEGGAAVFVDARSGARFKEGHIPGARNIDAQGPFASQMTEFWKNVAVDKTVLVYSDAKSRQLAPELARKLGERGYVHTSILADGLDGWVRAGGALTKEEK